MKVCMFEIINLQPISPTQVKVVGTTPNVPVNPDLVAYVLPAIVPSDLTGPDGGPLPREVSRIQFAGAALLVNEPREVVLWRLSNDLEEVEGWPMPDVDPEPEPAEPKRLRLIRPEEQ